MPMALSTTELLFEVTRDETDGCECRVEFHLTAGDCDIAWKVFTNAHKRYRVKPTNGVLRAGETFQVSAIFSPGDKRDPEDWVDDCFQVRSMVVDAASLDTAALKEMWESSPLIVNARIACTHKLIDAAASTPAMFRMAEEPEVDSSEASLAGESSQAQACSPVFATPRTKGGSNLEQSKLLPDPAPLPFPTIVDGTPLVKNATPLDRSWQSKVVVAPERRREMTMCGCSFAIAALGVKFLDNWANWMISGNILGSITLFASLCSCCAWAVVDWRAPKKVN
ncbi:hypothetical protein AB1Y20_009540 [Prymnesium parvum]|uniref:MSP domain-containing protein n=1 Tax=Prymnesium parvum TaxID=97485 RepID=A0AB34K1W5_PRYPA